MILQTIKEEQEHIINGTFPERYKVKGRTGDASFEVFRKEFLENSLAQCQFLAAVNNKNSEKQAVADPKEDKKSNPKLAFFKIRSNKTKV